MSVQKIMKHWENIANFLFTPISTFLDSLCGPTLPLAKDCALTTFVYRLRSSSPAANRAPYAEHIRDLSPCQGRLKAAHTTCELLPVFCFSVCDCTEWLLPAQSSALACSVGVRLSQGGVPESRVPEHFSLLKTAGTMLKAAWQRLWSPLVHSTLQCSLGGLFLCPP